MAELAFFPLYPRTRTPERNGPFPPRASHRGKLLALAPLPGVVPADRPALQQPFARTPPPAGRQAERGGCPYVPSQAARAAGSGVGVVVGGW